MQKKSDGQKNSVKQMNRTVVVDSRTRLLLYPCVVLKGWRKVWGMLQHKRDFSGQVVKRYFARFKVFEKNSCFCVLYCVCVPASECAKDGEALVGPIQKVSPEKL